jgi:hypothetical protein
VLFKSFVNFDVLSQDVFILYIFSKAYFYIFECALEIHFKAYVLLNGFIGENAQFPFYCLDFVSLLCLLALFGKHV